MHFLKHTHPFFTVSTILILILSSCDRNVEDTGDINCNPEPTVHEIVWMIGITNQEASITIQTGDTVRWIWGEENMPHDVSSDDANAPEDFGSEILSGKGTIYEYTFTEEVVFNYKCSIHSDTMFGTIT